MKFIPTGIIFIILLYSFSFTQVSAEEKIPSLMQMKTDVGTVSLTDKPCSFPVLLNMPYEVIATENGNSYTGCWNTTLGSSQIYVAFPDEIKQQVIPMPKEWFKAVYINEL